MAPYAPRIPNLRERGLIYGPPGSGKSTALQTIMRRQTNDHFYILDTEDDWWFSLGEDEDNDELLERGNFTIEVLQDNKDYNATLDALVKIREAIEPGNHFFYDKITPAWNAAQNWYSEEIFGVDQAEYVMEARRALEEKRKEQQKKGGKGDRTAPVFDQLRDWGPINYQYDKITREVMKIATVAHVWLVCDIKQIGENTDPAKAKKYRPYGGLPAGQGQVDVLPHTILHMGMEPRDEEFYISTVKDRGTRERKRKLDEEPWVDFSVTYLRDVARWKPTVEEGKKKKGKKK